MPGSVRVFYEIIEGATDPNQPDLNRAIAGQDFMGISSGFVDFMDGVSVQIISVNINQVSCDFRF